MIHLQHALVIGGTGMLAKATLWLSRNGYKVSVIGRSEQKMQQLLDENANQLTPVFIDYTNTKEFETQIVDLQHLYGPFQLIVAWVHASGDGVIPCLTGLIPISTPCKLVHVIGSSSRLNPVANHDIPCHMSYHQVQLGFKIEKGMSRWLIHEEISTGVINAVQDNKSYQVIGKITPWEQRP